MRRVGHRPCAPRRGFTLIHMISYLAILVIVMTMGVTMIVKLSRFQGHEHDRLQAMAQVTQVLAQFRRDVSVARTHGGVSESEGTRLVLYTPDEVVMYEWISPALIRTVQPIDGVGTRRAWEWPMVAPRFGVETIGEDAQVVWLKFEAGEDLQARLAPRRISEAVRLGGGGEGVQ